MALSKEVTKVSVKEKMRKLWVITWRLRLEEDDPVVVEVLNQTFTKEYITGDDIADLESEFQADMQAAIDRYKAEQVILNHPKMDTGVTNVGNNLVL